MSIDNCNDLITHLKKQKQFLRDRFGVTSIGVFGSFVNGTQTESSDVDVVIEIEKEKKNLHNFLAVKRLLENDFGRKVDIGFFHTLKPVIRKNIEKTIHYV